MDKSSIKDIENAIEKILQNIEIELVAMEYAKENKSLILRIFIDSENGVDMNTCTQATRAVKELIDKDDIAYDHLEVSSPGLDRVLKKEKDFMRHIGYKVKIKTDKEYDGPRTVIGVLEEADENNVKIKTDEQVYAIPRQFITSARLKPEI